MMKVLLKQFKKKYFRYSLMPLSFFVVGIIFFTLSSIEVANSADVNSGDVGFGYAASGVISIVLSLVTSVSIFVIYFFKKYKIN
ncbi:hypothetical protein [Enterococcus mundtii]|uniref:hypothetical protein n=1 Tax=Enterococcus mundtii TaxID=53346 RepID=UPI000CF0B9F4|nr:hypothetical protein [Enterococcus mundtii]PQC28212.1 hypothetical protein CUM97_13960 [Enterococcus mundtii]